MKRFCTLLALIVLSALGLWAGEVSRPAPPLTVVTPGGDKISLSDFKGKVVLLKFFLTDCPHCQRSATNIMPIYREWRSRGLEVLGVAINADAKWRVPEFAQRFGVTYPLALGSNAMITTFADVSAVTKVFVPYIFMIDRKGLIRYQHPGGDTFYSNEAQNLRTELDTLLKEPAGARKVAHKPASKERAAVADR